MPSGRASLTVERERELGGAPTERQLQREGVERPLDTGSLPDDGALIPLGSEGEAPPDDWSETQPAPGEPAPAPQEQPAAPGQEPAPPTEQPAPAPDPGTETTPAEPAPTETAPTETSTTPAAP